MTPSLAASYLNPDLSVSAGGHNGKPGGCVMEWISLLGTHARWVDGRFELLPGVTWEQANEVKNACDESYSRFVQASVWMVNDRLSELERQDLASEEWLGRILRARALPDAEMEAQVALFMGEHMPPNPTAHGEASLMPDWRGCAVERWKAIKPDPDEWWDYLDQVLDLHLKAVAEVGGYVELLDRWEADPTA